MQIINSINEKINDNTVLCIGNFDGIHLAHQEIISKVVAEAKKISCKSMVITFKQHSLSILNSGKNQKKLLMRSEDKIEIIKNMGVDYLVLYDFNEILNISHEDFLEHLSENYKVKEIICGFNFKFGNQNKGDIQYLNQMKNKFGFEVKVFEPMTLCDEKISSTDIRNFIEEGELEKANSFLGRFFNISGVVIKGKQLGRKIGFPTANLEYNKIFCTPQNGVYATLTEFDKKIYRSMSNIGYNPTFKNKYISIETNLFNFSGDLYGKIIKINFIKKLRNEVLFPDVNALIDQLHKDKISACEFIKKYLK